MTRIVAPRAKAIEQLTVPTFVSTTTPLRMWNSEVWDGQKWDVLEGSLVVGASTSLIVNQGHASGYWDVVNTYTVNSSHPLVFSVPLVGRYVQMKATVTSGLSATGSGIGTPTIFRLGSWGKHADGAMKGYFYGSGEFRPLAVDLSGNLGVEVTVADTIAANAQGYYYNATSGGYRAVAVGASGEIVVRNSGDTAVVASGAFVIAKVSGETVKTHAAMPSAYIFGAPKRITDASGGEVLGTGAIKTLKLRTLSGNMYVGTSGAGTQPWVGFGLNIFGGDYHCEVDIPVNNLNAVYIAATTSGDEVTYMGLNY